MRVGGGGLFGCVEVELVRVDHDIEIVVLESELPNRGGGGSKGSGIPDAVQNVATGDGVPRVVLY